MRGPGADAAREGGAPVIGYQRWDSLLFLHWRVPVAALRPLVPGRLEIDTFEGNAYVTLTPFTVVGARLRFLPRLPGVSTFHELNARTYVRLEGGEPGIWFFSLDAASAVAAAIARVSLRLPYFAARMSRSRTADQLRFASERLPRAILRGSFEASWRVEGSSSSASPDTLQHFLVERYQLFSRAILGKLWRGPVAHRPWPLQAVRDLRLEQTIDVADGLPKLGEPDLAQYSEGVDVEFLPFLLV